LILVLDFDSFVDQFLVHLSVCFVGQLYGQRNTEDYMEACGWVLGVCGGCSNKKKQQVGCYFGIEQATLPTVYPSIGLCASSLKGEGTL